MTGRLTLVLGGQKSGKSGLATRRATASGRPVVVVAPAVVRDGEFERRVERHRADRPDHWRTVETFDLREALADAGSGSFVIVDALDTWLAETLEDAGVFVGDDEADPLLRDKAVSDVLAAVRTFADDVRASDCEVVIIAGQPGLGAHAVGAGARFYVDLHGLCVQALSDAADDVLFTVGGRVLPLHRDDPQANLVNPNLREHGDTQVPRGAVDLAVNVQPGPPTWLAERLAADIVNSARYPDDAPARAAIAARHARPQEECLPLNGAAEAFWLAARVLRPRHAACVHPSFTEPEAALRAAGIPVTRVMRRADSGWLFDPSEVPDDADLVVLGRPDNPTGALDAPAVVEELARPGRVVLVDEAFADFLDDAGGFASRRDVPGVVSVRSLTKLWGLAGVRVGYLTGPAEIVTALERARQPWSVNHLALTALEQLAGVEDERLERAGEVARTREDLVHRLRSIDGIDVWDSAANFVLLRGPVRGLRDRLLEYGLAARRADAFPGLDDRFIRVAVRDRSINLRLADALRATVEQGG